MTTPDATGGYSVSAGGTDQADWGFLGDEDGEPLLSQPTNWHDFAPEVDVVGCARYTKPETVTTIGVRVRIKLERPFNSGEAIDLNIMLANSDDSFDAEPWGYWTKSLSIYDDASIPLAHDWHSFVFWFFGFPTQRQFINAMVIRRAHPWDVDGAAIANPDCQIFVEEVTFLPRDPSDAAHTARGGFGSEFGTEFGAGS